MITQKLICTLLLLAFAMFTACDKKTATGPDNQAPTASISVSASSVETGEIVTLDGTNSSDPDGDNLSFTWSLTTPQSSNAQLSDVNGSQPSFTADVTGDYIISLTVSDGQAEGSEDVGITANPCSAQIIESDIQTNTSFPDVCKDDAQFDYIVTGPIDINANATFEAGIRMGFEEEAGLRVNTGGALLAQGTEVEEIQLTGVQETPGFWRGIYFRSEDRTSELRYVTVNYAGNPQNWAGETTSVTLANDASLTMTNVAITNGGGYGLYVESRGTLSTFDFVTITGNDDAPIRIPDDQMGALAGSSALAGNANDYVEVYTTIGIDEDLTVPLLDLDYRMEGLFEVNAEVTIQARVRMKFTPDSGIRVNDGGRILAEGTENAPIIMENAEQLPSGNWRGILFRSTDLVSRLNYVEILNGGTEAWGLFDEKAAVSVDNDTQLEITNSTILIDYRSIDNVYALALNPLGELAVFENNQITASVSVTGSQFHGSVRVPDKQLGFDDSQSKFSDSIVVYATIGMDEPISVYFPENHRSYIMDGIFNLNTELTILRIGPFDDNSGVYFGFTEGSGLRVNDGGRILTDQYYPSSSIDIQFFSVQNTWRGILFRAEDRASELHGITIYRGGREAWGGVDQSANISVLNSRLILTDSRIFDSAGWGVFLQGGGVVFTEENNIYEDNALGSVGSD